MTVFPAFQEQTGERILLGLPHETRIIQLELSKKLQFTVKLPFHISWQSKTHITGIIIKSYIANLPNEIVDTKIKPIGRIKDKKSTKDTHTVIIQLKNLQPNGTYQGSIEYTYKPESWLLDTQWGKKSDIDHKLIQRYTGEEKYWRFPKEFEEIIKPFKEIDDVYTIAQAIYTIARKMIKPENLDYRKGIFNLLQDLRGDCDEFTDLMVVLLRKLAFPVKRATGMTYDFTTGNIVHHAWPEIYSPTYDKWIPIDAAMNYFGYKSLTIIPLKIEGTTVIPHMLEVNYLDPSQRINVNMKLLDTEIVPSFLL